MNDKRLGPDTHPLGAWDQERAGYPAPHRVETMGGPVHVSWDEPPGISTQSYECPLRRTSPNAPPNQEILGTMLLTILSGHWRYAHIAGIRGDDVLSQLLGLAQLRSVDSVRRAFARHGEATLTTWIDLQMDREFASRPPLCSISHGFSIWTPQ